MKFKKMKTIRLN